MKKNKYKIFIFLLTLLSLDVRLVGAEFVDTDVTHP
jgi:hypothetical protein